MLPLTPPPPPGTVAPTGAARRARRWPAALVAVALLGPAGIVVASGVTTDTFAVTPGAANSTGDRISVTGTDDYSAESAGDVLFVTVGVPRLNVLSEQIARREPTNEIVPARAILGDRTPAQNRQENLQLMGYSKDFASYVALNRLGFDITLTGGGAVVQSLCLEVAADGTTCAREAPAAKQLRENDVIIAIEGTTVHLPADITPILKDRRPGDVVTVTVKRQKEPAPLDLPIELTASSAPGDTRTIIGFVPNDAPPADLTFAFPVDIGIDSGQVGGPSAGLAFTLAVLDKLTPGDLTGGRKVAATGTMSPNERVGNIGGVRQKAVAVARAGADVFLVPIDEEADAAAAAEGTDVKVIGVRDLDDALAALRQLGGNVDALTALRPS